jgi:protocatechuate 3,4-dioxygenase beta subunit
MTYENRNQVDPTPLKLRLIKGVATDENGAAIPGVEIGLFADPDHALQMTAETNAQGEFAFDRVSPGSYRVVAKSPGYCPANVRVLIGVGHGFSSGPIRMHMRVGGIDVCSFGSLK